MLRDVVGNFLDSLIEREFDAPLLALLASQGFTDVHFIHGGFEFGKDVIAKRRDQETGKLLQYAIQSKAGDVSQAIWRTIRPQIEEAEYNTRAHPNYDESLPRVAVLVTTGRLKGAAAVDVQEYKQQVSRRGIAALEVWDRERLLDWLSLEPVLGLSGSSVDADLLEFSSYAQSGKISEVLLERYTRRWLPSDGIPGKAARAAIESCVIASLFRRSHRLDLASLTSLHLLRAARADQTKSPQSQEAPLARAAIRLFVGYATEILGQVEPLLDDPRMLLRAIYDPFAIVTYPVLCCRLAEIIGMLVLVAENESVETRARLAVHKLVSVHPGTRRPVSDQFAVSLIPPTVVTAQDDRRLAVDYLRGVVEWLLDRYDPDKAGLGLGSLDEPEEEIAERLLGGTLESTRLEPRSSSYIATVLMDLCYLLEAGLLYGSLRENLSALRILPTITAAEESIAVWRRSGDNVWPQPRIDYGEFGGPTPAHHERHWSVLPPAESLLLAAVCRSRHDVAALAELLGPGL